MSPSCPERTLPLRAARDCLTALICRRAVIAPSFSLSIAGFESHPKPSEGGGVTAMESSGKQDLKRELESGIEGTALLLMHKQGEINFKDQLQTPRTGVVVPVP